MYVFQGLYVDFCNGAFCLQIDGTGTEDEIFERVRAVFDAREYVPFFSRMQIRKDLHFWVIATSILLYIPFLSYVGAILNTYLLGQV